MKNDEEGDSHSHSADALYRQGNYEKASRQYQRVIENDPKSVNYDRWLECLEKLDPDARRKTIEEVEKSIEGKPGCADGYYYWGGALLNRKKWSEAIKKYKKATELQLDYALAYNNWGVALYEQKQYEDAITQYRKAIEVKPDCALAYNNWGNILYEKRNLAEAGEKYRKAIENDPKSVNYDRWLECLEKLDPDARRKAIEEVEKSIEGKPWCADGYNSWGLAFHNRKKWSEAIEKYRKATLLQSDHAFAYNNWGAALYEQKQYEDAITQYRKAIEVKPDCALAYRNWGNILYEKGNLAEAGEKYRKAIENDPKSVNYDRWLECLEKLDPDARRKTIEEVEKSIEGKPGCADGYYYWGGALLNRKKWSEAIKKYKKATELQLDYALAYNNWGVALYEQKQYEDAITQYRKAIELKPDCALAYNNWGNILYEKGNLVEAGERYQKAIENDPNSGNYDRWLKCLDKLDEGARSKAIETAREVVEGKLECVDAHLNWGAALQNRKRYDDAFELLKKAETLKPTYATIYWYWGNALGEQNRFEEAIEKFERAKQLDKDPVYAYHNIAYFTWRQGRYRKAWDAWEEARPVYERQKREAKGKRNADHFFDFGSILHNLFGEFSEAEQTLREGLALNPDHTGILSALVNLHLENADETMDLRKPWSLLKREWDTDRRAAAYAEARKNYMKAEELLKEEVRKKYPGASLRLGALYLAMKQYPAAEKQFKKALQLDPASAASHSFLGVLHTRQDAHKKAIQSFEDAIQCDPYDFDIRSSLADAYRNVKLTEKAEAEYKKVLEVTGGHIESHIGLGEVYIVMGDRGEADMYDAAISHLEKAITLAESRTGSKRLKKKELGAAYYSLGYARVKLYETARMIKGESLLHKANNDFKSCFSNDPQHHKARRAKEKLAKRLGYFSPQRLAETVGPWLIAILSLSIFVFSQLQFFFYCRGRSKTGQRRFKTGQETEQRWILMGAASPEAGA